MKAYEDSAWNYLSYFTDQMLAIQDLLTVILEILTLQRGHLNSAAVSLRR
jgi:hypothetical protein